MEKKPFLEMAKIINTHGVRGEVKLEPWCDKPENMKSITRLYLADGTEFSVSGIRVLNGGYLLCVLSGITTVEQAAKLKNKVLFARREDIPLPAGSHFIADLIGLPVLDADSGKHYGTLREVTQGVAQDIYEIAVPGGRTVLLPAVPAFIARIDEDAGIFVTPIPGFFDEEAESPEKEDCHAI